MTGMSPNDHLSAAEREQGLRMVIRDGLATQAMVTLTGGVFLVAFALLLGASNTVIGLLAAIPALAELIQIPSVSLVALVQNRRVLSVAASMVARLFWLVIAAIPFLVPGEEGVLALVLAMCCYSCISAVSHCSWNSWMRDLIPRDRQGAFFSHRLQLSYIVAIVLSLVAALIIERAGEGYIPELNAYSALFVAGWIAGMFGIYYLSHTPEPRFHDVRESALLSELKMPISDENFANLLIFLGSWNFAINLAAPFFTVYMLRRLGLEITWVIALAVMSQTVAILSFRLWGHAADRFSYTSVLRVSGPIFIIAVLAWTFTTLPDPYFLTVPLLIAIHVLIGLSTAGVTLSTTYIGLKLAPEGHATAYITAASITNYLAAGIAPVIGGLSADFFAARALSLTITWTDPGGMFVLNTLSLQHWDFFFIMAFFLGLYALHRLSSVHEEGEVKEQIVVRELLAEARREMRNLSTVGGLRIMVRPPVARILRMREKKKCGKRVKKRFIPISPSRYRRTSRRRRCRAAPPARRR